MIRARIRKRDNSVTWVVAPNEDKLDALLARMPGVIVEAQEPVQERVLGRLAMDHRAAARRATNSWPKGAE